MSVAAPGAYPATFDGLAESRPDEVRSLTLMIGGRPVAARVAGDELAAIIGRSFVPGAERAHPALRLDLWDEAATGLAAPGRPREEEIGERWGPAGERLALSADGRRVRFSSPEFEIHFDRDAARATGWVGSAARLNSWHRARPLQALLMPFVNDLGLVCVHATAVGRDGVGVLVAGASGRGKSTTAAAAAAAGMTVLGDDAIALELAPNGTVRAHCMHAAIKLRGEGLARHPELAPLARSCGPPWQDERVVFLNEAAPRAVGASMRIAALAFPQLGAQPASAFAALAPARALALLTGCNISVEPSRVAAGFELIAAAVERLPAYRFTVGSETAAIPRAFADLLASPA